MQETKTVYIYAEKWIKCFRAFDKEYGAAHDKGKYDDLLDGLRSGQGYKRPPWAATYLYFVFRSPLFFDLSDIAPGTKILKASLVMSTDRLLQYPGHFDVIITSGMPTYPHYDPVPEDYDLGHYSGNGGSISTTDIPDAPEWRKIALNSTGMRWVEENTGGMAKFLLISSDDLHRVTPPEEGFNQVCFLNQILVQGDFRVYLELEVEAPPVEGFTLTTSSAPPEGGLVVVDPDQAYYDPGTEVKLLATPAEGYSFSHWSGDAEGTDPDITIVMDRSKYVIANFTCATQPDIPIISDILQWLKAIYEELKAWILSKLQWLLEHIKAAMVAIISPLIAPIKTAVDWIKQQVLDIWSRVVDTYSWVKDLYTNFTAKVGEAISSWFAQKWDWLTTKVSDLWSWLEDIYSWIEDMWQNFKTKLIEAINAILAPVKQTITGILTSFRADLPTILQYNSPEVRDELLAFWPTSTSIWDYIKAFLKYAMWAPWHIHDLMAVFWAKIRDEDIEPHFKKIEDDFIKIMDPDVGFGAFVKSEIADPILDAIQHIWEWLGDWFKSVWQDITEGIKTFFTETLPGWFATIWEKIRGTAAWIWDKVSEVASEFLDMVLQVVNLHSPILPEGGMGTLKGVMKVGLALAGGLGLMTIAGNLVHPLHSLGLEHVSAMVYDMTNYKVLIGAGMGVIAAAAIRTPLTYYFNNLLRPWMLRPGDFMELLSREAFEHPELLRTPGLSAAAGSTSPSAMIGYYGYPSAYLGFFRELANTRLGYFPLAGIARSGFWDEEWFTESLQRTGYSITARTALMKMYREMVNLARIGPSFYQLRRLAREGFASFGKIREYIKQAEELPSLTEARLFAMELEREYGMKEMSLDIALRAFSRRVIDEGECKASLTSLGIPAEIADLHIMKEKLGLVRRVTIPLEEWELPPLLATEE